jgi:hypothetical protein
MPSTSLRQMSSQLRFQCVVGRRCDRPRYCAGASSRCLIDEGHLDSMDVACQLEGSSPYGKQQSMPESSQSPALPGDH